MHTNVAALRQEQPVEAQEPGQVVPLFRGRQSSAQPLVTLANGLWKKPDVARHLGVSERTIERWMLREGLPADKPWGAGRGPVRFDPRKVVAWWDARCANAAVSS